MFYRPINAIAVKNDSGIEQIYFENNGVLQKVTSSEGGSELIKSDIGKIFGR